MPPLFKIIFSLFNYIISPNPYATFSSQWQKVDNFRQIGYNVTEPKNL